jgi:hypothetical protein
MRPSNIEHRTSSVELKRESIGRVVVSFALFALSFLNRRQRRMTKGGIRERVFGHTFSSVHDEEKRCAAAPPFSPFPPVQIFSGESRAVPGRKNNAKIERSYFRSGRSMFGALSAPGRGGW